MGPRAQQLHQLHASWDGAALALWGLDDDGDTPTVYDAFNLRQLATVAFGYAGVALMGTTATGIDLPGVERTLYAPSLRPFPKNAYSFVVDRYAVDATSASLRWIFAAADLAQEVICHRLIAPAVRWEGSRWEASWQLRTHPAIEWSIRALADQAPPAVWTSYDHGDPVDGTRAVVQYFVDGAARWALDARSWGPDLGPSTKAPMVMNRRVCASLRGDTGVHENSEEHRRLLAAVGAALDENTASLDAGLAFRSRARLATPSGDDNFWRVAFEVVLVDDPSITFPWSAAATASTDVVDTVGPTAAMVMEQRVRGVAVQLREHIDAFRFLEPDVGEVALPLDAVVQLLDQSDQCADLGCAVLIPKNLAQSNIELKAVATTPEKGGVSANLGQAMVDIDWQIVLGDEPLSDDEITELADAKADLVQLRGTWVRVDAGHVERTLQNLDKRRANPHMNAAEVVKLQAELGQIELADDESSADGWLFELLSGLPDEQLSEAIEPAGFVGQLRPYQRRALGWLGFLAKLGLGGCLADDMGLGKTPTTLAHLLVQKSDRPSLVMCPLSVVHNWEAEAERFTPDLRVVVAHGAGRKRGADFTRQLTRADLVISTYGTVTRDIDAMAQQQWNVVVCDEAQAIKNHRTKTARAVRKLPARQLVALTGTPVENRLSELWSILDAANPGSLGGIGWFRDTFASPIETSGSEDALDAMKRLTSPFVLRRTKADKSLVPDLPDKVEQVAWAPLTEEQVGLYQAVLDDFLTQNENSDAASGGMKRRGLVLATLTRLKQICNHPAQFLAAGGEEPGTLAGRSGKLDRFDELVEELLDAGERALIFTQYRKMGELLVRHLAEHHEVVARFLHGGVAKGQRDKMVASFQSGDGAPLQVVSLKAGGTGLNLTAASRVIHYDRWWNPAVEDQATDRAWRIGQTSTVFVHKLVCRGTLEERIDTLLQEKKALADSAVGSGESWLTEMSTEQLRGLFSLDASTSSEDAA